MKTNTNSLYRPCVGIALFNTEGLVFMGERINTPPPYSWQMPQGGIDEGEGIEDAAFRELHEEIGTDKAEILKIAEETISYDLPEEMRARLWQGRFQGQEQTWVAMRFTGKDSDINLNHHHHPEFQNWKWEQLESSVNLVVPFKQDVYRQVIEIFSEFVKD